MSFPDPLRNLLGEKPGRAVSIWSVVGRLLLLVGVAASELPFLAVVRGAVVVRAQPLPADVASWLGVVLAFIALLLGSAFFIYSVRYYVATITVVLGAVLTAGNGNGNNHYGNRNGKGTGRIARRTNGNGNGNGKARNRNGNGNMDLGYEPFVSIHVAAYNEKRVIERLLEACTAIDYRNYEIVLVDDSTDESAQILERWKGRPGLKIVHRTSRSGFKGGALSMALAETDSRAEFVAVFDADSVPFPDSIQRFLPAFYLVDEDGKTVPRAQVAAVQSYQWHVLNKSESWLTEAVRAEYAGSYMVDRVFQEAMGSLKMVAGTAYMIRADVLREIGWGHSLTEDWQLTLRLYERGYKVAYTPYAEAPAECVATFLRLARQRMRWAEGHTHNVRRFLGPVLRSRRISGLEKLEFLFYYSGYYLQSALFVGGTTSWLLSEIVLRSHVPEWTSLLGWSLVFSSLIALPLMNLAGLILEEAPAKDFLGVPGALIVSFLLVPFQCWASVKGLFEKDEGPWFRTPKSGRITDPVRHLRRIRHWLRGPGSRPRSGGGTPGPPVSHVEVAPAPALRPRRVGWVVIGALALVLLLSVFGGLRAPGVEAAGSTFWLQSSNTCGLVDCHLQTTAPNASQQSVAYTTLVTAFNWSETQSNPTAQTVPAGTAYTFTYSSTGGQTINATITFYYSLITPCLAPTGLTNLISWSVALADFPGNGGTAVTSPASAGAVTIPGGAFLCLQVSGTTSSGTENLLFNDSNHPTNISTTATILAPERVLPLLVLGVLLPIAIARWHRPRKVRP